MRVFSTAIIVISKVVFVHLPSCGINIDTNLKSAFTADKLAECLLNEHIKNGQKEFFCNGDIMILEGIEQNLKEMNMSLMKTVVMKIVRTLIEGISVFYAG